MNDAQSAFLTAGVQTLADMGTAGVTARTIAGRLGVAHSGIVYYWRTSADLLDAVALEAIRTDSKMAVARLIADGHASVASWSVAKRRGYLAALA